MRRVLGIVISGFVWFCVLLWMQVVAPPWLALAGLLIWLRTEQWYVRAGAVVILGIGWSVSVGSSPVWGMLCLAGLLWLEKLLTTVLSDIRWRIWVIAGLVSLVWSLILGITWTAAVFGWWVVQGVVIGCILRFFPQLLQFNTKKITFRQPHQDSL